VDAAQLSAIGKYEVMESVAQGPVTELLKARLRGLGGFRRVFAIRRVLGDFAGAEQLTAELEEAARVAALLSHGNLVQLLDLGRDDGRLYLVAEYVDGVDFARVLAEHAPLPLPVALYVGLEVLKGLEYAHTREVVRDDEKVSLHLVHGDVEPSNVLLSFNGEVKLSDFGVAAAVAEAAGERSPYRAPEGPRDGRSDLYGVGRMLYIALSGVVPAEGMSLKDANGLIDDQLAAIVDRAMASPSERFATSSALLEALDGWAHSNGVKLSSSVVETFLRSTYGGKKGTAEITQVPDDDTDVTDTAIHPPVEIDTLNLVPDKSRPPTAELTLDATGHAPVPLTEDTRTVVMNQPAADDGPLDTQAATVIRSLGDLEDVPEWAQDLPPEGAAPPPAKVGLFGPLGLGAVMLLVGTLLGVAVGITTLNAGFGPGSPSLQIVAPNGAKVFVNDRPFTNPNQVAPGQIHVLRVETPGHATLNQEITLRPGEQRIVVVEQAEVKPLAAETP